MALRLEDIWRSMPIITKSFGVACLVTTLAIHLEYVSILQVYLNFHQVIYQLEVREIYFQLTMVFLLE